MLVAALALLLLAACGGDDKKPQATATPRPAVVTVENMTLQEVNEGYAFNVRYPRTGVAAADTRARQIIDDIAAQVRKESQQAPPARAARYTFDGSFTTVSTGPDVLSLRMDLATYTGGAHGAHYIFGLNYDLRSGRGLDVDDALKMAGLTLTHLSEETKSQLNTKLGRDFIFPDGADAKKDNFKTFLISADKLTFVFQEYQVAPYSSGPQEVGFPRKASAN